MNRKLKRSNKQNQGQIAAPVTSSAMSLAVMVEQYHKNKEYQKAIELLNQMLKGNPTNLAILEKLSIILGEAGQYETALKVMSLIKKINPKLPATYLNSAAVLCELGKFEQAKVEALTAYEIDKNSESVNHRLAFVALSLKDHQLALKALKKLLDINPKNPWASMCLASLLYFDFDSEDAKKYLRRAYEATGLAQAEINYKLYMPIITSSNEQIEQVRAEYEKNLDELLQKNLNVPNPQNAISRTSFYLAYHGKNNKDLMIKLANLYEKVAPELTFTAPHCIDYKGKKRGEKIKVGFISMYFGTHSVGRAFNHIIAQLSEYENIEGYLLPIVNNKERDLKVNDIAFVKLVQSVKNYLIVETISMQKAQEEIAKLQLDVLVYTDIGMDQFTYCLAFARLAPVQCLLLGHPDTTGIKTIDYYFTAKGMDNEESQNYYSEKLVYFNEIPAVYGDVKPPENPLPKNQLGLSETANNYVCPMKNQKIHPDFDLAVKAILQKDKNANIYFFEDRGDRTDIVLSRLKKILTLEEFKRVKQLPWMEPNEFWNVIFQADVILDTFHFGAGTTAYQVLGIGTPFVGTEGVCARSRMLSFCYRYMGITDTIAKDFNDYVQKAIEFANNKQLNQEFRARVLANNSKLFNNFDVVPEIQNFFEEKIYKIQYLKSTLV